jgi:hypothetical protein
MKKGKVRVIVDHKSFPFKLENVMLVLNEPTGGALVQVGNSIIGRVGINDKQKLEIYWNAQHLIDWLGGKPKKSELSKLKLLVEKTWEEIEAYNRN